jgi:hypothetical protein
MPKKSLFKRFWWIGVLIIVVVVVIICGFILTNNKQEEVTDEEGADVTENDGAYAWVTKLTEIELEAANLALSQGIKIDDPEGDFYVPVEGSVQADGRPDNPTPYPIPFTDLKSLSMGADQENLYIKLEVWGEYPIAAYRLGILLLLTNLALLTPPISRFRLCMSIKGKINGLRNTRPCQGVDC